MVCASPLCVSPSLSVERSDREDKSLPRRLVRGVDSEIAFSMPMPRLILASQSPRRRQLLQEAGLTHEAMHPGVDDGQLSAPGDGRSSPEEWSVALAFLKASSAASAVRLRESVVEPTVIVAADTIVHHRGVFVGQPKDLDDAERILQLLDNDVHEVVTGVALLDPVTGRRDLFADRAVVTVGAVGGERIGEYLATGLWKGKAGAYNLSERIEAGWPIAYEGDAGTIMGLPVGLVKERLGLFVQPVGV